MNKQLCEELKGIGVDEQNMSTGTIEGQEAVFLYKNGYEYQFTGFSEDDIMSGHADDIKDMLREKFSD